MKQIKAIMCDLDGTLLCDDGYVSEKTLQAIKKIREKGIVFGIATGRDILTCENLFEEWGVSGLIDMIAGVNGAHIKDYTTGRDEMSHPLRGAIIKEIMEIFDDLNVNYCVSKDGFLQMAKDDAAGRLLSKFDKIPMKVVDFSELANDDHDKLLIVCDEERMPLVIQRASEHPDARYISMNTAPVLYEFMDYRVSKANGLQQLMEERGWTMDNLMVFGDANNDYDMVLHSGVSVCMSNGCDRVKDIAHHITEFDNNHDGIGAFLDSYF